MTGLLIIFAVSCGVTIGNLGNLWSAIDCFQEIVESGRPWRPISSFAVSCISPCTKLVVVRNLNAFWLPAM